jgi:hypothetical protein
MLRGFVLGSLSFDSVFVGYKTQISILKSIFMCIPGIVEGCADESLNQKVMKIGYQMTVLECVKDASGRYSKNNCIERKELCEIVSRSYIEELF